MSEMVMGEVVEIDVPRASRRLLKNANRRHWKNNTRLRFARRSELF